MTRHRGEAARTTPSWRGIAASRLALLITTLIAATSGLRPAAAVPHYPVAFRHTTFTATRSSAAHFRLTRPSTFHLTTSMTIAEVTVRGRGRMAGLVIASDRASADSGALVYAMRFNGCWKASCATPGDELVFPRFVAGGFRTTDVVASDGSRTLTIPAGAYAAYVVTDGAPVVATVDFSGASGSGTLAATSAATAKMTSADSTLSGEPTPAQVAYSAGATGSITSSLGLLVAVMEVRSTMHASTAGGVCYYRDLPPPTPVYVPGCPGGTPSPLILLNSVAPMHQGMESVSLAIGSGDWTQGVYLDGAYVPSWVSPTAMLWLTIA
jgi:hypothetical protein